MVIFTFALIIVLAGCANDKTAEPTVENISLHQQITRTDVTGYKMSKWVNENSTAKQVFVSLSEQEIDQFVDSFNSVPDASVEQVERVDPQVSAGIVLEPKNGKEIRIQYAKNQVYVTRNDLSNDFKLYYYKVNDENLKGFFDTIIEEKR